MPILPVLDLMNGQIVRGIGGRRDEYRPIVSQLVDSAEPLRVAQALHEHFGFRAFYVADLDAIQGRAMALDVYGSLLEAGHHLWIDAGCRSADDAALDTLRNTDNADIVVGLESVQSPVDLQRIVERVGPNRAVFSLDLMAGQPLGNVSAWPRSNAWTIAEHAIGQLSVRRLIVLDLANVGVGNGVGTEDLCVRLKHTHPQIEITTGGGVRGIEDVRRLTEIGVNYVLVASALHDGRITRDDIQSLAR